MDQLSNLLAWNTSARDPIVLLILLGAIGALTMLLATRPRLYLPLILFTAPLPKLFTITQYEAWGNRQNAAGFSVVDMVLAAGMVAISLKRVRRRAVSKASATFGRALLFWFGSVVLSVGVGLILWPEAYQPSNALYAFRYGLTLISYAVAAYYASQDCREGSVRALLRRLAIAGNVTIALGLLYYFRLGPTGEGGAGTSSYSADLTVFRSFLFFFDYATDMGYYTVAVAILNLVLLAEGRRFRVMATVGLGLCITAVLLLGERANLLVLGVSVGWFLWETRDRRRRSLRVSGVFRFGCVLAMFLAGTAVMRVVAPQQITTKFEGISADSSSDSADVMREGGVPEGVIETVTALRMGDFTYRLSLAVASLWFFFRHLFGVGFWGELSVVGWYAHHEIVKIAVEQSFPGLAAFVWLIVTLRRLLWDHRDLAGSFGQLGLLLRSLSVGMFTALILANTVLLGMKFPMVYWTLLGIWSVLPRSGPTFFAPPVIVHLYEHTRQDAIVGA